MRKSLWTRIWGRVRMTISAFRQDCRFSIRLAVYRMIDDLSWRLGLKRIAGYFHQKKDQTILDTLERMLRPVIDRYADVQDEGEFIENAPIWVCWWTGEETAPPLVKRCMESIRKNAGEHPVYLVTQNTYAEWMTIPPYILQNIERKTMGFAHLADYIRVTLLAEYGGLWLDATIFCADKIPKECFNLPIFTCKSNPIESRYLSRHQWTTFCLGGYQGNVFYRFLREAFEAYWEQNAYAIDYLFFDHLIYLAKKCIPAICRHLESIPVNNLHRDDLQAAMNAALAAENFEQIIRKDTVLYKLSWRESYSLETAEGTPSVYARFLSKQNERGGMYHDP